MNRVQVKIISIILVAAVMFNSFSLTASAYTAWPDFIGNGFGSAMDNILVFIKETIWAAAKTAAIEATLEEVNGMIGDGSDGASFVTDWREELKKKPEELTKTQVTDFFDSVGQGHGGNYVASDGSAGYAGNMIENAKNAVLNEKAPEMVNLSEYGVNDPSQMFSQGNLRAFLSAYGSSGKIGNVMEATLAGYDFKAKVDPENKDIAGKQAVAYGGFSPETSNGQVITPGSTVRDIVSHAQNMSFQSLANAKTVQEVIAALVSRLVSNVVHKGIGNIKSKVQKNMSSAGL